MWGFLAVDGTQSPEGMKGDREGTESQDSSRMQCSSRGESGWLCFSSLLFSAFAR